MIQSGRPGRIHYGWIVVAAGVLVVFGCVGLARFGFTMILPAMKDGLGLNDVQSGDLAVGNMLGYLGMSLICGLLAARFGPRIIVTVFMVVVGGSMILTGLAEGYPAAVIGRTLTGIGSGGTNIPIMALGAAWFAREKRGLAVGIVVSGSSFGLLLTGRLIPFILESYGSAGWRVSWYVLGGLCLLIAVAGWILLRDSPQNMGLKPVGYTGQSDEDAVKKWTAVYQDTNVWHLAGVYILFGFSYVIYVTFFARYLTGEVGLTAQRTGTLWSVIGALSIGSGFLWGSVSDRLGRKYGLALVFLLQALCFGTFGLWRSTPGIYLSAFFFALTSWSIPAIMSAACADIVGSRLAPAAFGFVTLFFGLGQVAGPFVAGRVAQAVGSYSPAFTTAAVAALLGSGLSLLLKGSRPS